MSPGRLLHLFGFLFPFLTVTASYVQTFALSAAAAATLADRYAVFARLSIAGPSKLVCLSRDLLTAALGGGLNQQRAIDQNLQLR